MRGRFAFLLVLISMSGVPVSAQERPPHARGDHGVIPDDELTLVVGTRFVEPSSEQTSPTAVFRGSRLPIASLNDTDRCIDDAALQTATEYFKSLGRVLGKSGHYYYLTDDDVDRALRSCEQGGKSMPKAFDKSKTKILAFGKVVPTRDASTLEESLR